MSKFISLLSTFKNGLVSPRLRGSIKQPDDFSSAEVLDDFIVDRVGTACKREGFRKLYTQDRSTNRKFYSFELLGTEYHIHFNQEQYFNAAYYSSFSSFYASLFCQLADTSGNPIEAMVFSKDYRTSATDIGSMGLFNGRHTTGSPSVFISNGVESYLQQYVDISHAEKISERTVLFTTVNNFSFFLSLFDYVPSGSITSKRVFVLYPYFVSGILLQAMLGKNVGDAVKCPIVPSNYPFNPINTDTTLTVSTAELVSGSAQTGSAPSSGIVLKSNERQSYVVTVPKGMAYSNSVKVGLEGRFIIVPSSDATKDVVFFLTTEDSSDATTITYKAILCIGGVPPASTSQWKLSTWGSSNHPRAVGYCFGRLILGNVKFSPSQWWASAIHPDNPLYLHGFKGDNLLQDVTSDFSGINYAGKSGGGSSDIYRWSFTNTVPNFGAIGWISSRRRIHFGTSKGESQLSIENGVYSAASYAQLITGTDKSDIIQQAVGNRKIFYISNDGRDIRSISTEDKDYESVDKLLTVPLEGLGLKFIKINWVEEYSCLFALTSDSQVYALAIHGDTEVRAISKLTSNFVIKDFSGQNFIIEDVSATAGNLDVITNLSKVIYPYASLGDYSITLSPIYVDFYEIVISAPFSLAEYGTDPVYLYFEDTLYYIADASTIVLNSDYPFDIFTVSDTNPMYVFKYKCNAKLKTLPIHQGANLGSSVGSIQRVDRVSILIDKSGPFKYGSEQSVMINSENVGVNDTSIVVVDFPASPEYEQHIYIESDEPTPLNISGISLRGVSYAGE